MKSDNDSTQYHDYLRLDQLLSAQSPRSLELGRPAHDEMLFIIVHHAYELWFKQLNFELDSILAFFNAPKLKESDLGVVEHRLRRMVEIIKLLIDQVRIMETMTPMDFLEFRDLLYPASGFQSFQFRRFEILLGLESRSRVVYNDAPFFTTLKPEQRDEIKKAESQVSLFEGLQKWLERTPFLKMAGYDFWDHYRLAVKKMIEKDREQLILHSPSSDSDQQRILGMIEQTKAQFDVIFDEQKFNESRQAGVWRLSYPAVHAALLVQLYREQPIFQVPFRVLTAVLDIDELLTTWRYRHALMARRMLGTKVGTGGSSGYDYLRSTSEKHRIFADLFQLTTFFIPRSQLPELPDQLQRKLDFNYQ